MSGASIPLGGEQDKISLEVEVVQRDSSNLARQKIEKEVDQFLRAREYISSHSKISQFGAEYSLLCQHVESLVFCQEEEVGEKGVTMIHLPSAKLTYQVYKLNRLGPEVEEICQEGEEEVPAAQHWILPNQDFQGVWENLVYDTNIKWDLLRFVATSLLLSDKGVDQNIVCCNRVVLLHGPPGTGKTSLCKALAQKLSIRLASRYTSTQLVEINSHSLFSKWFSESGKLVQKMFTEIKRLMEDTRSLVCVLIDEVESLTAARKNSMSGSEPSDALRVVNALLTQLDSIKNAPNVLILTTSNITGAIDLAFVDRADIKQYVGPPSQGAIYQILHSCVVELVRTGLVGSERGQLVSLRELKLAGWESGPATFHSLQLWEIASLCTGMSGRTIRKMAFLALALFSGVTDSGAVTMEVFLDSLKQAVRKQIKDREELGKE
eukprot:TRINITY_DN13151_c0_g1_i1.p1 TRINITY_DN13151_c0_g1~~TRINITY_DN13151_c0_g1_i1.p1  ORF type:complete len:436 (+),score=203.48 TRINITY_DN13151_c0_g1_i1:53-1360(+)